MLELHIKRDIEKISSEILKGSKSFDIFPTPVDNIVSYADLIVNNGIDLSKIHPDYISQASNVLYKALGKVRGILDRKKKIILLDLEQLPQRKNFVKLHEVGHHALDWQRNIFDLLGDDDDSLDLSTREQFEAEANYFASITIFQHDRFLAEVKKYNLSIESAMKISAYFGASIHATLRRYVEFSKKRYALLVLENIPPINSFPICHLKDCFISKRFSETFGPLPLPSEMGYKWPFVRDYYYRKKFTTGHILTLSTNEGKVDFHYQFFYNGYNGFVFLYPKGEKQNAQNTVIITGSHN